MPHFYFHLRTPEGWEHDQHGVDFVHLEAAYLDVCRAISGMAAELVRRKRDPLRYVFEIVDEGGQLLMEVPFSEMLGKRGSQRRPATPAFQKAHAEMERTARLMRSIEEARTALQTTLRETHELAVRAREASPRTAWLRQGSRGTLPSSL